jgi:Microcystin-dependent protein
MEAYLGLIFPFAGAFAPQGTVQCWGQDLPQGQNQALFAIIGTMYGGTSPNFRMPDLRGRVLLGSGASPYLNNVNVPVASSGGSASMTLSLANLPPHTHAATFTPGGGSSTSTISANVTIPVSTATGNKAAPTAGNNYLAGLMVPDPNGDPALINGPYTGTAPGAGASLVGTATGNVTINGGTGGAVSVSPGGGQAGPVPLSNMQPYLAVTFYIVTMGLFPTRD